MKTLGLRHIALNVRNAQASKKFYCDLFDMQVEWEPDPKNVYLTSQGQDNLALHEAPVDSKNKQTLDHMGFIFRTPEDVDQFHKEALAQNVVIAQAPKLHRDGAYSCYIKDPDGIVIQAICHPPIVKTVIG